MSSISQSVERCFALLALFADRKTGLTAVEISAHLDAPRSSVAALLKELVELSMISLNRRTSTYLPTMKFAQLGSWLTDPNHFPPSLAEMIERLQEDCGETVTVSWPIDHQMEIIRVVRSRNAISFVAESGQRLPLWTSAVGAAYLASLTNAQIGARWEKDRRLLDGLPQLDEIVQKVSAVRSAGFAVVHEGVFEGASAMARGVRFELDGRPLVVSIAGPHSRMMNNEARYLECFESVFEGNLS